MQIIMIISPRKESIKNLKPATDDSLNPPETLNYSKHKYK